MKTRDNRLRQQNKDIGADPPTGRFRQKKQSVRTDLSSRRGFGLNEVIGIAAGIIIAAVVVIPGLQSFATSLIGNLESWWNDMAATLFASP